ncbi:MAG TPA: hypothetical protein VGS19_37560 [Streptosporangiaceae bacterium]|nr:hypothetical protein [Streptosporangiaceae bacterium]
MTAETPSAAPAHTGPAHGGGQCQLVLAKKRPIAAVVLGIAGLAELAASFPYLGRGFTGVLQAIAGFALGGLLVWQATRFWRGVKNAVTRPFAGALMGLLSIAAVAGGFSTSGAAAFVLLPAFGFAARESWGVYCGDRDTRRRVLVAFWSYASAASLLAVITQHAWAGLLACPLIALYVRYISRGGAVLLFPIPF